MRKIAFYSNLIAIVLLIFGNLVTGRLQDVGTIAVAVISLTLAIIVYLPQRSLKISTKISSISSLVAALVSYIYLYLEWKTIVERYTDPIEKGLFYFPLAAILLATFILYRAKHETTP